MGHFEFFNFSTNFWIFEFSTNFSYIDVYMDRTSHIFFYVDLYMDRTIHTFSYVDVAEGRGTTRIVQFEPRNFTLVLSGLNRRRSVKQV